MLRVLIVDDEPVVLEILRRILEHEGHLVVACPGRAEALSLARERQLDVALLDKNLVGASGLELARELRVLQPELEVILLTGYATFESAVEAVQAGIFDYLTKPVEDFATLATKVRHAGEKSQLRRDQRELLRRLTDQELRYKRLVESSPDAMLLVDAAGRIEDANPAACRLYGRAMQELQGLNLLELQGSSEGVQEFHRKRGGEVPVEVTSTSFEQDGRTLRLFSVRDVSARRQLEEQVRISQKMEAIGRLAGGVAHDFNNLLAVFRAHGEFLAQLIPTTDPSWPDVEGILRTSTRGAALTHQLLLFSRRKPSGIGHLDPNASVIDLQKLLSRVLGAQVQVAIQLDKAAWPVRGDPDQLSQVLLNLSLNARDAMPQGGQLVVRTENFELDVPRATPQGQLPAGRYVHLSVRDTGSGMTPEVQARIFEPFFTTKPAGQGTGLGLATARAIVHGFGGLMEVDSSPGAGTCLSLWLPATEDEEALQLPVATIEEPGRGETVLLVEDDEALRALVRRILANGGYQVLEARDGTDGLAIAQQHQGPIAVLLTDVIMPHLSGVELASQVKAAHPEVRVLYMTAHSEQDAGVSGLSPLLAKPFTATALLSRVRRLLG